MARLDDIQKRINRAIGQLVAKNERSIARRYAQALNTIRAELGVLYSKYEKDGKLTYIELAKYDRLNKFLAWMDEILGATYKDLYKSIYAALGESFESAYTLQAWAIEQEAMQRLKYGPVTAEVIEDMINNPVKGLTLKKTLQHNRSNIIWTIQQEITQGLVAGESYGQMAGRIKPVLENDAAKAIRIVRTESHRVEESGKHDATQIADNQGVRMTKTWNNVGDSRVRKTSKANHRDMDGVTLPMDGIFKGRTGSGPCPGSLHSKHEDINCRCFLTYSIDRVTDVPYNDFEAETLEQFKRRMRG